MVTATMTQEARISTRIDKELKTEAEALLAELGMKPSQAIAMFYKQIVRQRGYPFELKVPNAETLDAFQEAKNPNNLSKYDTVTEGLDDVWESE